MTPRDDLAHLAQRAALAGPSIDSAIMTAREAAIRALELAEALRASDSPAAIEARLRALALHHDGARLQLLRAAEVQRLRALAGQ